MNLDNTETCSFKSLPSVKLVQSSSAVLSTFQNPSSSLNLYAMDLSFLLIGVSIAAGVHMVLFFVSTALAILYFRRFKKLRARLAEQENDEPDVNSHGRDELGEQSGGNPSGESRGILSQGAAQGNASRRRRRRRRNQYRRLEDPQPSTGSADIELRQIRAPTELQPNVNENDHPPRDARFSGETL